jgi:catechol 2,3-dioxygenase-like lactoylglutathione lyase family enzyme
MTAAPKLRIARPTDDPQALLRFYQDGLGFEVLGGFKDHAGFDGIFLGRRGWPYHLAFTVHRGHPAGRAPTQENLLIFYVPDAAEWQAIVDRMTELGFAPVASINPYWEVRGKTFEDPDGYRVVLECAPCLAGEP